jgi:hypothetical protein
VQTIRAAPDPGRIAWQNAACAAWFTTRLEVDKALLALGSGGIALLVTLLLQFGLTSDWILVLYLLALLSFAACVASTLAILRRNSTHIERASGRNEANDPMLTFLDRAAVCTFCAGVIFSGVIGISSAIQTREVRTMATINKTGVLANDSVNRAVNLRNDMTKSLNNAVAMKVPMVPAATTPGQAPAGGAAVTPPATPASGGQSSK